MTIRRSHGGTALFPLRVTGAGGTDSIRVMLRDLPETVRLSNGVLQDEHTWGLRLADLEDLHVTLGDVTPDAFDVTVEVASVAGTQVAKTVAHVRLSDRREVAAAPALPPSTAATIEDLLRTPVAPPQAPGVATPFRTEVKEVPRVEELAGAVPPTPPPTPEGLSSLGGPRNGAVQAEEGCGGECPLRRRRPGRHSATAPAGTDARPYEVAPAGRHVPRQPN